MTETRVGIRTSDRAWAARHGVPGTAGRTVVTVDAATTERVRFAGHDFLRFDLAQFGRLPSDWANRWAMIPASHVEGDH